MPNSPVILDDAMVLPEVNSKAYEVIVDNYKLLKAQLISKKLISENLEVIIRSQSTKTNALFRKSSGEINAKQLIWFSNFIDAGERNSFNYFGVKYEKFDIVDLKKIKSACDMDNRIKIVKKFLRSKGINLFFIACLPGTKIDGATYINSNSVINIGLTVRYDRLDYLWFTLLHELSHVVLHMDFLGNGIVSIEGSEQIYEIEANRLAKEIIIPPELYRVCTPKKTQKMSDLIRFSVDNKINPVLLAGIIRKDLDNYMIFSDLINNSKIKNEIEYE